MRQHGERRLSVVDCTGSSAIVDRLVKEEQSAPAMTKPRPLALTNAASAHISAALRHVRDAEHLLDCPDHTSPDQAYHLAGLGPECARKATIVDSWLDKVIGHGTTPWADEMVDFALAIDPVGRRYDIGDIHTRFPELAKWSIDARYDRTNTHTVREARSICREAREIIDSIVIALWADGRLDAREALT